MLDDPSVGCAKCGVYVSLDRIPGQLCHDCNWPSPVGYCITCANPDEKKYKPRMYHGGVTPHYRGIWCSQCAINHIDSFITELDGRQPSHRHMDDIIRDKKWWTDHKQEILKRDPDLEYSP